MRGGTLLILAWWPHGSSGPNRPRVVETCAPGRVFIPLCDIEAPWDTEFWLLWFLLNKEHVLQAWTTHVGRTVVHKYWFPTQGWWRGTLACRSLLSLSSSKQNTGDTMITSYYTRTGLLVAMALESVFTLILVNLSKSKNIAYLKCQNNTHVH